MPAIDHGGRVSEPETQPCSSPATLRRDLPLPPIALSRAALLAAAVHDEGPRQVAAILRPLTRQDVVELAICLAAMVPIDYTPAELLAWNDDATATSRNERLEVKPARGRELQPCGTHAAHNRHKLAGEEPCDDCKRGERRYQAQRAPRRPKQQAASRRAAGGR